MAAEYDLVILGGGTGGYVAAIRAAQLGLKTAIVEKDKLGGTCLHRGCIPTKALLRSAEVYTQAKAGNEFGVVTNGISLDFSIVQERKRNIIEQLYNGVKLLIKKRKIDIYNGIGRILGPSIFSPLPGTVSVEMKNGSENEMLIPKNLLISTGSIPRQIEGLETDGERILTSDDALEMETLPGSIIVAGGGVIGLEWASLLSDFGVQVTILESGQRIISGEDLDISRQMKKALTKKGIKIFTGVRIFADSLKKENGISIAAEISGEIKEFSAEKMLLAVGRKPNIRDIGLENTTIEIENGYIVTNEFFQTKEPHIYAVGDCIGGMQLAHAASREGITAVEHMAGKKPAPVDYNLIPRCIYTSPETASMGLSEEQAREKGYRVKTGKFPMRANGRALVFGEAEGFVKVIADHETDDLLGVHIIGPHATEMISEAALAGFLNATPWEVANVVHPHPTLSEAIMEAALAVEGKAIHG